MPIQTKKLVLSQETLWWLTQTSGTEDFTLSDTEIPTMSKVDCTNDSKNVSCPC